VIASSSRSLDIYRSKRVTHRRYAPPELLAAGATFHREAVAHGGDLHRLEVVAVDVAYPAFGVRGRLGGSRPTVRIFAQLTALFPVRGRPDDVAHGVDVDAVAVHRRQGTSSIHPEARDRRVGHFVAPAVSPGPHLPPARKPGGKAPWDGRPRLPDPRCGPLRMSRRVCRDRHRRGPMGPSTGPASSPRRTSSHSSRRSALPLTEARYKAFTAKRRRAVGLRSRTHLRTALASSMRKTG